LREPKRASPTKFLPLGFKPVTASKELAIFYLELEWKRETIKNYFGIINMKDKSNTKFHGKIFFKYFSLKIFENE
jgi:hypothetical protein